MAVTFAQFEDKLAACGTTMRAAEAHGMLCGVICSGEHGDAGTRWLHELLKGTDRNNLLVRELAGMLENLVKETIQAFESENFEFDLLLPGDQEPVTERTRALSEWCQGFYLGLALGGVKDVNGLPEHSREFVLDMMEIGNLDNDGEQGEEAELALTEIIEYVRVGVLLVREELRQVN